jgi:hypothetical protein
MAPRAPRAGRLVQALYAWEATKDRARSTPAALLG